MKIININFDFNESKDRAITLLQEVGIKDAKNRFDITLISFLVV